MRLCQALLPGHFDPRLQLEAEYSGHQARPDWLHLGVPGIQGEIQQTIAALDALAERLRQPPPSLH